MIGVVTKLNDLYLLSLITDTTWSMLWHEEKWKKANSQNASNVKRFFTIRFFYTHRSEGNERDANNERTGGQIQHF